MLQYLQDISVGETELRKQSKTSRKQELRNRKLYYGRMNILIISLTINSKLKFLARLNGTMRSYSMCCSSQGIETDKALALSVSILILFKVIIGYTPFLFRRLTIKVHLAEVVGET